MKEEGTTPQSAAADSSPYILRTDSALRAAPVLRSAYFPKRVHRTLFSKTLDLQPLCGLRKGAEGGDNPSVCCGRQLPLHSSHRNSFSSYSGVAHGLFYEKAYGLFVKTHMLQPQAACEGGSRRRGQPLSLLRQTAPFTFFAPTQLFELRRCCGRLIFRKEYTVLFSLKRSTFNRFAACEREPKEGTTPQSAAADSSPYILRTEIAFQAIPVLRMAYFTKRPMAFS